MTEGSGKSMFIPPTLGDQLRAHGMRFVLPEEATLEPQNQGKSGNNSNRRNSKRSEKENNMPNEHTEHGEHSSQPKSHEKSHAHARPEGNPVVSNEAATQMAGMFDRGLGELRDTIIEFSKNASILQGDLSTLEGISSETRKVAQHTMEEAKSRNDWSVKNLKGDARGALVHVTLASIVGLAVWGISTLLRSGDEVSILPAVHQANGAAVRPVRTTT